MKMDRGNIWLVELTKTPSDIVGHEEGKTRPCLIIVNNQKVRMTTIIPLTGNLNANRFTHTYTVIKSSKNGLTADSIALIFQIRSLSYERYITHKGKIGQQDLSRILEILKQYLKI
jgi:mRNA-degrading endonuclease toxin of MazEF toxin-antitoxin module